MNLPNLPKASIYLRLKKEKSTALQEFLRERGPESELASSILADILEEEQSVKESKLTPCIVLGIERALDLEIMLKKELLPDSTGDWTPLHSVRMNLLESITAHFHHVPAERKEALLEHRKDSAFAP